MFLQEVAGDLEAKIESLLNVEKKMRLDNDVAGTKKAVTDILQLCYEAKAWKTLNDQIVLLSKRRGQLKQVRKEPLQLFVSVSSSTRAIACVSTEFGSFYHLFILV